MTAWIIVGLLLILIVAGLAAVALLLWALDLREDVKTAVAERDLARADAEHAFTERDLAIAGTRVVRGELVDMQAENNRLLDELHAERHLIETFIPDDLSKEGLS